MNKELIKNKARKVEKLESIALDMLDPGKTPCVTSDKSIASMSKKELTEFNSSLDSRLKHAIDFIRFSNNYLLNK